MSTQVDKLQQLIEMRQKARLGGGEARIEKQHARAR